MKEQRADQMNIRKRYRRLLNLINDNITDYPRKNKTFRLLLDFLWDKIRYKTQMNDYIQYEFYKKTNYFRREFIDENKRKIIHETLNDPKACEIFNNKALFNKYFLTYVNRDWLDTQNTDYEEFEKFVRKHKYFFVKPAEGWFGIGAGICYSDKYESLKVLWNELKEKKAILEECIQQCSEMAEFNRSSVNTLRVVTVLCTDNKPQIMTADLRMGRKDKTADNFHHNGIAALIDIETGIIYTQGIDKNRNRYIMHPDSKKQIVGFIIPYWEKVKKTVKEAAKVVPSVRYVGWDIAIGEDGQIIIVEGNCMADPDVTQMPDGIGKWPLYSPIIEEFKRNKK